MPEKLRLEHLLSIFFFLAIFFFFYHPIKIGDFWWHLNTGRWIWDNASLPSVNPFTFTGAPEYADRTSIVMKGYWLSQLAYYVVFKYAGFQGIVVMNAALYTSMFYVLWRITIFNGLKPALGLVMIVPGVILAAHYDEVRPQSFSFLNVLLEIFLLERGFGS